MADKTPLKVGHLKITDHLILGVTDVKLKKGLETFEHSTLEMQTMLGWNNVADALSFKNVDAAFLLAPTAIDLFKSGVGITLVLFTHKSGSILVKAKNANINKLEDFGGKVVLIPYQLSVHNVLFHKLLADKGLKPGTGREKNVDVLLEVMAPTQMPEVLEFDEDGEIGGFIVAEPIGSMAIAKGMVEEVCLSKDLWPNHPCCALVVRNDVIQQRPEAVQELIDSLVKSGNFIADNPSAAASIGGEFLGVDKGVIEKVLTDPPDRIITNELLPNVNDLAAIQDYMCDAMKIVSDKIDISKFVDTSFAQRAGAK